MKQKVVNISLKRVQSSCPYKIEMPKKATKLHEVSIPMEMACSVEESDNPDNGMMELLVSTHQQ